MSDIVSAKKPTSAEVELLLLEETTEDWKGLWELCWALRTDLSINGSDAERGALITPVMRSLLQRGLITFRRNQWAKQEYVAVPMAQVDALLADEKNWSVPPTNDYYSVWCAATAEGKRIFSLLLDELQRYPN